MYMDVKIDEKNLYNTFSLSPWELADDVWSPSDDFLFADPNEFDEYTNKSTQRNTPGPFFLSKKTASPGNQDLVGDNQEQSAKEKEKNELTSKTIWKTMKMTMTRLLVLHLTVLILSLDGQLEFRFHGNYFLVKSPISQVHSQNLTAKTKKVYLNVIKNLLIMLACVRPNLTNI